MPKILVNLPNSGPVDVDVPGWGLFANGSTFDMEEEAFDRWLEDNTTVGEDGELVVADLPYGLSIVDDDVAEGE